MIWEIEYTDEFGDWWARLSEEEQVSLLRPFSCLRSVDQTWASRTAAESTAQSTITCES